MNGNSRILKWDRYLHFGILDDPGIPMDDEFWIFGHDYDMEFQKGELVIQEHSLSNESPCQLVR